MPKVSQRVHKCFLGITVSFTLVSWSGTKNCGEVWFVLLQQTGIIHLSQFTIRVRDSERGTNGSQCSSGD